MTELLDRYINYLRYERNASPHTIRNYQSDLLQFRDYLTGGDPEAKVDLRSVDALRIRGFLALLFEREKKKTSIARKLAAVRAFYKFLAKEGVLAANPAATVSTPKLDKTLPRIMTEEEMNNFLDRVVAEAVQSGEPMMRRDRAILELLYASGLRVSELAGLDLRSVNFGDGMLAGARQGPQGTHRALRLKGQAGAGGLPARSREGSDGGEEERRRRRSFSIRGAPG